MVPPKKFQSLLGKLTSEEALRSVNNLLVVVILILLVRTAWVSDDAYITMRTVGNFVNGHGLVFNLGERVQSYTHPLWLFAVTSLYFFTHHAYYSLIITSILVSLVVVLILKNKLGNNQFSILFGLIALVFSKSFIDYSTGGLENPLSHLLAILFVNSYLVKQNSFKSLFWITFLAALAVLNRMDLLIVFLPAVLTALIDIWNTKKDAWKRILLLQTAGWLPLIIWLIFSFVYYGFVFPNTGYAKLGTGIPRKILLAQGVQYFIDLINMDTLTVVIIIAGLALAFHSRNSRMVAIASGVILYLGYILYIGGDFMSGRFFSTPFLLMLTLIINSEKITGWKSLVIPLTIIMTMGLASPYPSLFSTSSYGQNRDDIFDFHQIADERANYYPDTGLLRVFPTGDITNQEQAEIGVLLRESGAPFSIEDSIGFVGYFSGPNVYCVDVYGLVDPLIARLPAEYGGYWRIGHFWRFLPDGYRDSLKEQRNLLTDPDQHEFFDQLLLITRGPIFDPQRWVAIWKMNTGQYDYLLP